MTPVNIVALFSRLYQALRSRLEDRRELATINRHAERLNHEALDALEYQTPL